MSCPICRKRRIAKEDTVCRTCRQFIGKYIDTGLIPRQTVPMVADVLLVMREIGIDQDCAVIVLGGTP